MITNEASLRVFDKTTNKVPMDVMAYTVYSCNNVIIYKLQFIRDPFLNSSEDVLHESLEDKFHVQKVGKFGKYEKIIIRKDGVASGANGLYREYIQEHLL